MHSINNKKLCAKRSVVRFVQFCNRSHEAQMATSQRYDVVFLLHIDVYFAINTVVEFISFVLLCDLCVNCVQTGFFRYYV